MRGYGETQSSAAPPATGYGPVGPQVPGFKIPGTGEHAEPTPLWPGFPSTPWTPPTDVPGAGPVTPPHHATPQQPAPGTEPEPTWPTELGDALAANAAKVAIAAGLILGTGVVIGYLVGRGRSG